jgi:hypothetical protein
MTAPATAAELILWARESADTSRRIRADARRMVDASRAACATALRVRHAAEIEQHRLNRRRSVSPRAAPTSRGTGTERPRLIRPAPVDVVPVVWARKAARIAGSVRVPAVDELGRSQRPLDGGELAHEPCAGAGAGAAAGLVVDGADVHGRPALWLESAPSRVSVE